MAAITVISVAVSLIFVNSTSASKFEQGVYAYSISESGAENALMRLIRNPNYSGETLLVGGGSVTITVTGTTAKTIIAEGTYKDFYRKVAVQASYAGGFLTVTSWKEIQ